ncbi:DNA-(apurinic or apyrimidinic site) lyase [Salsuginibacillus halophilus]|uniref:Formamidopyrimidine-DNA glycosylase n=1 Tax=Salsuginibacillus halophilus TaxID=517424 RepID=A0A2P8HCV7_9BACI|nr:DNA-formamidopyrimidine glycosylase [Salsuginibacillus halophilus]PSL44065.1 DNA-(apurinic or apyrimidinic site) lyase [Salsuginibacillus halophilus]
MPELPEVETVRRTLEELVQKKTIETVHVDWPKMIKAPDDAEAFITRISGQTLHQIRRIGKFLLFDLDEDTLVSHLRMEGKYFMGTPGEKDKHTHVRFCFTDGTELHYNDVRKFGTMHVFPAGTELRVKPLNQLGPEPFADEFTLDYFQAKCFKTTRFIKAVLLDQSIVTGLGNIYADEALFQAGVHPETPACDLKGDAVAQLYASLIATLRQAVEAGGTSVRSYVNGQGEMGRFQQQLFVYGRSGESCFICDGPIEKSVVAGRGTHTCACCQPKD